MTEHHKYYLTTSNFRKLVFKSHIEVEDDIMAAFREVFEDADLAPYLSHKEVKSLLKCIIFLQKSDEVLAKMEKQSQERIADKKRLDYPNKFLFVAGAPKYHFSGGCKTLGADFENFEVPDEVQNRGPEEMKKFREFALENRKLLSEGREDVFCLRLKNQFHLTQPLGKVSAPNSGTSSLAVNDEIKIDDVVASIHKTIAKLEDFRATEEGRKYMYASTKALYDSKKLGNIERELLETKRELINLVLNYHVKKEKGGAVTYSAELLKLFGFEPCGVCCQEEVRFDLE